MKITTEDVITELKRELDMRARLYPQWIQSGKLNKNRAAKQYLAMKKALELIEQKQEQNCGIQKSIF